MRPLSARILGIIEVDRRVEGPARGIDVHDLEVFSDRPRLEIALPRRRHGRDADVEQRGVRLLARVVGVDPQAPVWRVGNLRFESQSEEVLPHRFVGWREGRRFGGFRLRGRRRRGNAGFLERGAQSLRQVGPREHCFGQLAPRGRRQQFRLGFEAGLGRDLGGLKLQHRQFRSGGGGHRWGHVAKQQVEEREIGGGWRRSDKLSCGRGRLGESVRRPEHAVAEFVGIGGDAFGRAFEERLSHRFDPHPAFGIGVEVVAMLFYPEGGRGGDLGSGRRSPVAVEIDDGRLAEARPRHVRRVGRDRRPHLAVRTVVARHPFRRKVGVGAAVGHHAARGDHATEAGRVDDETRGEVRIVVSGRRDHDDARLIERIDCVGPRFRWQASHAHAHDMHARRLRLAELVNVIEPARDGAVAEQHDAVRDADRDDFGVRRAAKGLQSRNGRAGKDAERAAAVTEIVEKAVRAVGGVLRPVRVDEIAREIGAQISGDRFVVRVIAGVEMRDPDPLAGAAPRRQRLVELAVLAVAEPVVVVPVAGVAVADVLGLRPSGPHSEIAGRGRALAACPLLLQVRLDEGDAGVLREYGVTVIPGVGIVEFRGGGGEPPDAAGRRDAASASDAA